MDLDQVASELNDLMPLLELAMADHPEDYNLEIIYDALTRIIEEIDQ